MSKAIEGGRTPVLLKIKEVIKRTGLSRSSIYNKMDRKSRYYDPTFPCQVRLGPASVAWVESEVEEWILSRIKMRGRSNQED